MPSPVGTAVETTTMFLSEEIIAGDHRAGDRITESQLVDRYDVSRSTARAALQVLAGRGLVELQPSQGARVTELFDDDAAALYRLRTMVEPLLVAKFTSRASARQVGALDRAVSRFGDTASCSENLRHIHRDRDAFYEVLFEGAQSVAIENVVRVVYGRLAAFRRTQLAPERELQRIRFTARIVQGIVPRISQREIGAVSRYTARTLAEDGATTLRLLGATA